MKLIQKI